MCGALTFLATWRASPSSCVVFQKAVFAPPHAAQSSVRKTSDHSANTGSRGDSPLRGVGWNPTKHEWLCDSQREVLTERRCCGGGLFRGRGDEEGVSGATTEESGLVHEFSAGGRVSKGALGGGTSAEVEGVIAARQDLEEETDAVIEVFDVSGFDRVFFGADGVFAGGLEVGVHDFESGSEGDFDGDVVECAISEDANLLLKDAAKGNGFTG